jgi:predicted dehydrogenase
MKIGIIGMSEGNGHPYSWSAIFNGYDKEIMKDCPFPVIPEYLDKQSFPADSLGEFGEVTHIWTQDIAISRHIAASTKIEHVVENLEDMIGEVDAVLLARDDAENHYKMALPFLKAGIPIFIDKPLALSVEEANNILREQQYENQVFSCSSIRFANELNLTIQEKEKIGKIVHVEAAIPKKWDTYAIHLIESIIARIPQRGKLIDMKSLHNDSISSCIIKWENTTAYLKVTGNVSVSVNLTFYGEHGFVKKEFNDSYACFKKSLHTFVEIINGKEDNIEREETLEIIRILEKGRK